MFMECRQLPLFYFILPGKMYFLKSYVDHLYELLFYHLQVKFFLLQVLWNYLRQEPSQLCFLGLFLLYFQFPEFIPGVLFALL